MMKASLVSERRTINRSAFMVRWYEGAGGRLVTRTFATQREAVAAAEQRQQARSVEVFVALGAHGERWMRI